MSATCLKAHSYNMSSDISSYSKQILFCVFFSPHKLMSIISYLINISQYVLVVYIESPNEVSESMVATTMRQALLLFVVYPPSIPSCLLHTIFVHTLRRYFQTMYRPKQLHLRDLEDTRQYILKFF